MTVRITESSGENPARRLEQVYEQTANLLRQPDVAHWLRTVQSENEWSAM